MSTPLLALVDAALAGGRRALARLLSWVERGGPEAEAALARLYPRTGRARLIGVTGPPGSGKSTLIARLAQEYRRRGFSVAVLAVDPSSPLSGGALLGDRVRMSALGGDTGLFIRSMASRGTLGGLAQRTDALAQVLDACGYQRILIETVGAGQNEFEIARLAHTTLVLQVPGLGDEIQVLKAGILELADLVVVNKADQPGAARTVAALETLLPPPSAGNPGSWQPRVLQTVATAGQGTAEVVDAIEQHVAYLQCGALRQREHERLSHTLNAILSAALLRHALARLGPERYQQLIEQIVARELDPYTAAHELMPILLSQDPRS